MGDISINDALERIRSTKKKDRDEGLADLKHILTQNRRSPKLKALKDKGYHKLIETLFRFVQAEKSIHAKASSKTTEKASATRLSVFASVLRTVVESGVRTVRYKTIKALIEHITQTLPVSDEHYCEPLVVDYIKALRITFEYQPHAEHLLKQEWLAVVDFCLEGIQHYTSAVDENDLIFPGGPNGSDYLIGRFSRSTTPGTTGRSLDQGSKSSSHAFKGGDNSSTKNIVEELVVCLCHLTLASNAPILERAQVTITVLLDLLQSSSTVGRTHQAAFFSINSVLARTITENVSFTQQILKDAIPLVRRFWSTKSAILKEEMLICLIYGELYMSSLLLSNGAENCRSDLQGLLDVLQMEYCKRPEREQLQLDDLDLSSCVGTVRPLSIHVFSLRSGALKSEPSWALLHTIASVLAAFEDQSLHRPYDPGSDGDTTSRKRRKLAKPLDDLLYSQEKPPISERLYALQVLTFALDKISLDVERLQSILEYLIPYLSDDTSSLANWAILAITCVAYQKAAFATCCQGLWLRVWQLAVRNTTSVTTCRAACYLMTVVLQKELIQYMQIADIADSMLSSVDLNGPAMFTESAVALWSIIITLRGRHSPGLVYDTSERVLRWLVVRWRPSNIQDRYHASHLSQHSQAHSIIRLISAILGLPHNPDEDHRVLELGRISQARLRCLRHEKLTTYLLLAEEANASILCHSAKEIHGISEISLSESKFQTLCSTTSDFLAAEITALLRVGPISDSEGAPVVNTDVIRSTCSLCVVAYALLSNSRIRHIIKHEQLLSGAGKLRDLIVQWIHRQDVPYDLVDGVLASTGIFLGPFTDIIGSRSMLASGAFAMTEVFNQTFWQQLRVKNSEKVINDDLMDINDNFESQGSHGTVENPIKETSHDETVASTDLVSVRASLIARFCLMSSFTQPSNDDEYDQHTIPMSFIEYLTTLDTSEFLACRPFLKELFDSGLHIQEQGSIMLLEYLGKQILESYDLERCEVSLGVCLDIMTGLADSWTRLDGGNVSEIGANLYEWFINIALGRSISSPHVHVCISSMLQRVIKVRPDYAKSLSLPSARTSLFRILEEGSVAVKYCVGLNISDIFGLFILKEHDMILEDIIGSLPSERDWVEGIALRLLILAHLASSWSTLLRRCIYAIFETPGHVPGSTDHAEYCVKHVASALGLTSPQELFKLFVSQIIYTWLEMQPLRSIPYTIFGYSSLTGLLRDVQDEVTGQIVMRGKQDEAVQLAQDLKQPYEKLLEVSFSKATAYSIARDAAIPPGDGAQASGAEVRLRKHLGKEQYASLITRHFSEILALFYKTIDQEEHITKGFQKRETYAAALEAYDEMVAFGSSKTVLPVNQQPSFKAGYLIDEIEYLCQRSNYDSEAIWTPALYIYTFRELLSTIHKALGSLHACSVIRRIRILICMAGKTALQDYPLEMALHALRPFLTDSQCAEDAIGVSQYLIGHGARYLTQVPSFLAGLAVSTLASLKTFLNTSQESTTQESQFRATMSKAQSFHAWLSKFLDNYTSPHLVGLSDQSFRTIVNSAGHVLNAGNATKGTYESDLLLALLEDQHSGRKLINPPSQDLILSLLCSSFEVPESYRDDILGSDEQAARYASVIWRTCQRMNHGHGYRLWAGRVLGRAYGGAGVVDQGMLRELHLEGLDNLEAASTASLTSNSRSNILRRLWDILLTDNRVEVGVAENTLQIIMTRAEETEHYTDCEQLFPTSLLTALLWRQYQCPVRHVAINTSNTLQNPLVLDINVPFDTWVQNLCIALVYSAPEDPILSELPPIIEVVKKLPEQVFPYILHLVLLREANKQQNIKHVLSDACRHWFTSCNEATAPHIRIVLYALLYLRSQPLPHETTKADRSTWLELDYRAAAGAAAKCRMFKTALLFLEISFSEAAKSSRRSSSHKNEEPTDLLLHIFQNLDDKDSFYGIRQPSSLFSMMDQLEYENAGFKSLSFRGAYFDSQIRLANGMDRKADEGLIKVLDTLDLNGLSQSLLSQMVDTGPLTSDAMLRTARKLEQWDVSSPVGKTTNASTIFSVFQDIHRATDMKAIESALNCGFSSTMNILETGELSGSAVYTALSSLAVFTEIDEIVSSRGSEQLQEAWSRLESRNEWMLAGRFEHINTINSCRETLFSTLSKDNHLQLLLKISQRDSRAIESRVLLASSNMSRRHGALQSALATATCLSQLVSICEDVDVKIHAAARFEGSNVLWDQGEMSASIRMLQDLEHGIDLRSQDVKIGKPKLLAKLGHRISEARLEKPDEIITNYLTPAIKELRGVSEGDEAGQVFHEFAAFCDQQLQNSDNLEDFKRIERLRERKEAEVRDLEKMIKSSSSQAKERDNLKSHRAKAKQWFELDDREFRRLRDSREAFLRQSLENYLLSLKACDRHDSDALRFSALWLEHSENDIANAAVSKYIALVGSRKFASLMNQWSSRLLDVPNKFQALLSALVLRICIDHPYHGMYQVFASSKTKGGKDESALARNAAATNIVNQIKGSKRAGPTWMAVHNSNINFVRFAIERLDGTKFKPGSKVPLRKSQTGQKLEQDVSTYRVPPPTMKIQLRADCDYGTTPLIVKFQPDFTVASGISMPKILTALASDGQKYKQLFKGGNDDLRQDSIMEQVFEQVSNLLQTQRDTRQRNLGIRTYKVLPLTATSGIIEFVSNTVPLHDYLMPAHQRHFPSDMKPNVCRKHIADAQPKPVNDRIKIFRHVTDRFHPVLRYFFMERFENPDDWFEKRLAYTRSTAAISILGHVLGLGDRHGHNILLDEKTGEVVHIDLGIAFEQGRVLPVPEVVPFRLTRDLVDGMGITKTEGVFRRCCEFTLEALRNESYSIMTILDVLRYDPLYSWSLSPLRLKKMQDAQTEAPAPPPDADEAGIADKKKDNEPGEADRALTVVAKKLSKSLSVTATVNELIQQATDEKNLALLFCGWAAYA